MVRFSNPLHDFSSDHTTVAGVLSCLLCTIPAKPLTDGLSDVTCITGDVLLNSLSAALRWWSSLAEWERIRLQEEHLEVGDGLNLSRTQLLSAFLVPEDAVHLAAVREVVLYKASSTNTIQIIVSANSKLGDGSKEKNPRNTELIGKRCIHCYIDEQTKQVILEAWCKQTPTTVTTKAILDTYPIRLDRLHCDIQGVTAVLQKNPDLRLALPSNNLIRLLDVTTREAKKWVAFEPYWGESLSTIVRDPAYCQHIPMLLHNLIDLVAHVTLKKRIQHGDIKPGNVLCSFNTMQKTPLYLTGWMLARPLIDTHEAYSPFGAIPSPLQVARTLWDWVISDNMLLGMQQYLLLASVKLAYQQVRQHAATDRNWTPTTESNQTYMAHLAAFQNCLEQLHALCKLALDGLQQVALPADTEPNTVVPTATCCNELCIIIRQCRMAQHLVQRLQYAGKDFNPIETTVQYAREMIARDPLLCQAGQLKARCQSVDFRTDAWALHLSCWAILLCYQKHRRTEVDIQPRIETCLHQLIAVRDMISWLSNYTVLSPGDQLVYGSTFFNRLSHTFHTLHSENVMVDAPLLTQKRKYPHDDSSKKRVAIEANDSESPTMIAPSP
ncbi:MAG: hypothetical protein A3J38_09475 [Gammaproteobacteria bacterium RIFCSPHIGHO2_12_FULL_45_9]|nr:MAG: hypothetical protein A3J38_09475 [Gammaproteobacteria bacterium RIFCSPHIGHO2_12_FULL_45_9]